MPALEEMQQKLDTVHLPLCVPGVLRRFARTTCSSRQTAESLVVAWENACEDAFRHFPRHIDLPLTHLLHAHSFPAVIEALTPDPEVAQEAKAELKFLEEIRS